jgi:hypothetical protein
MPQEPENNVSKPLSFEGFFETAEGSDEFWVESAKLEFTEEMLGRMKEMEITKTALAERLQVQPSIVTRLVSGHNNFTLRTMVKIARRLDSRLCFHLEPEGTKACWINFLAAEPEAPREVQKWNPGDFTSVGNLKNADATLQSAA